MIQIRKIEELSPRTINSLIELSSQRYSTIVMVITHEKLNVGIKSKFALSNNKLIICNTEGEIYPLEKSVSNLFHCLELEREKFKINIENIIEHVGTSIG